MRAWGEGHGGVEGEVWGAWGEGSDVECGWAIMGDVAVSLCRRGRAVPCWQSENGDTWHSTFL